jgi:putative transcriptional regulator
MESANARIIASNMDWSEFDALDDNNIAEAVAGDTDAAPLPLDVSAIRRRTGLDQTQFARLFGIPLGTLRNWEQYRREPEGAARSLLRIINHDPKAALQALRGKAA